MDALTENHTKVISAYLINVKFAKTIEMEKNFVRLTGANYLDVLTRSSTEANFVLSINARNVRRVQIINTVLGMNVFGEDAKSTENCTAISAKFTNALAAIVTLLRVIGAWIINVCIKLV